jgi:hypothetical protein
VVLLVAFLAVRLVVLLRAVAFLAAAVRFTGDFFVALAVVVLRVELDAASVDLVVASSSLAGTCASCGQDVRPVGRRSSRKKIALPRA